MALGVGGGDMDRTDVCIRAYGCDIQQRNMCKALCS